MNNLLELLGTVEDPFEVVDHKINMEPTSVVRKSVNSRAW